MPVQMLSDCEGYTFSRQCLPDSSHLPADALRQLELLVVVLLDRY